jgi:starvation-inducible DNA-binding protein
MSRTTAPAGATRPALRDSREPRPATRMFPTKNDLPEDRRREIIELLNQRLADCIDLQTQCKQAHWNVKGPSFIALHKLFDEINADVEEYVDLIAERVVQLGGVAEGTARIVAVRSTLIDYPLALSSGAEHVAALSDSLAAFGRTARMGIEEMNDFEDADSADILTEISRGVDKWLWFVEAHQQGNAT